MEHGAAPLAHQYCKKGASLSDSTAQLPSTAYCVTHTAHTSPCVAAAAAAAIEVAW